MSTSDRVDPMAALERRMADEHAGPNGSRGHYFTPENLRARLNDAVGRSKGISLSWDDMLGLIWSMEFYRKAALQSQPTPDGERERLAKWIEGNVAAACDEMDGTGANARMMADFARVAALLREAQQPDATFTLRDVDAKWIDQHGYEWIMCCGEGDGKPLLAAPDAREAERSCGLFHVPLEDARRLMPSLPWGEAPIRAGVEYIADVKVHKLMPGQWPCIPNWHCDFVPRDSETLVELPDLIDSDEVPMLMWLSGPPFTEFRDGRPVPARTWVEFDQMDEHRGVAATEHCWRTFIRLAPAPIVRAGLPHEQIPAPPDQWIRRHAQVYLDAGSFKW